MVDQHKPTLFQRLVSEISCSYMISLFQFECGGMIHEEAPNKLCEAFRLFLQGMGYGTVF